MYKIFLIVFLLATSLFCSDEALEKVTLQLHWKYQFEFAGFIAAKEKGFYKDVGLDVTLKEYKNGINIIDDVTSNKVQYGIYNSSTLVEYLRGKPIVLVASFFKRAALVLIVKPTIHSPKDLRDKLIMSTSIEDFTLNFKPYFDAYNVKISNLKMVPNSFNVTDFAEGKVDAMTAFISDQPYRLDKLGVKYNILDPSSENLFVLQEELFTSRNEMKNHPKRVEAFREASIRGWQYALSHKKELISIIHNKYNKKMPLDALHYEANAIDRLILPSAYDIGSINRSFLNKQKKIFQKEYQIKDDKNLNDYIFTPTKNIQKIYFNDKELAYMKKHKDIKVCVNYDLFPLDGVKNKKLRGEMADIFSIISKNTSMNFIAIKSNSEKELINNIKNKRCQLFSLLATSNKKFTTLRPTTPFGSSSFAILSSLDRSFIDDSTRLKDKLLIVQKDSFKEYLKYLYPYLHIKVEYNKNKMVKDILLHRAYAIVTLDEQADYFIDKYGYGKLKINGFLAKDRPLQGSIGVQKDEPILYSIIEKILLHIPKEKIDSIKNSWRISRYQTTIDYSLAWKILFFMGIILLIMIYYQRKLKNFNKELEKQVFEKTKELREINESLEETVQEKIDELIEKDEILTMQAKQAVMGEMISMIAHQWRQPLNTITLQVSNIQLKEMMGDSITKEELLNILDEISNSVIYLSNTIDDFKTYFHPGKAAKKVILKNLISKAVGFIEPRIRKDNILIEITGAVESEVVVYANELIQVILNILNNAIDAYEICQCDEKKIQINIEVEEERVLLSILDNAGGIDKEHIKQIFDPYFSTKGKNGTGLGLYMSKMIIEKQFDGKIKVKSSDAQTLFIVEIPKTIQLS